LPPCRGQRGGGPKQGFNPPCFLGANETAMAGDQGRLH